MQKAAQKEKKDRKQLTSFRAYLFGENDHIIKAHVLEADTDDDAYDQAQTFLDGHDVEVWDGARLVARLPRTK